MPDLPYVDEHAVLVHAAPEVVWTALVEHLRRAFASPAVAYARVVRADPAEVHGTFPGLGSTVPAFRVEASVPGLRLRLGGRHHFAAYAMDFTIEPSEGATTLRIATYARFPGLGALYRLVVIGSGGHGLVMRRLLRGVRRRAEAGGTAP